MEEIITKMNNWGLNITDGFIYLFKFFLPFLILLIIYFIIKVLYRRFKYGYKEFKIFRKPGSINFKQEMMFFMLQKIKGYRKIYVSKNLNSHIVIVDETGIYLLYIFNNEGIIKGESEARNLTVNSTNKNKLIIQNPYSLLEDDEKNIKFKIKLDNIHKCIIVNNNCILDIKHYGNTEKIYFKDFFYKMESLITKGNKVYEKDEIAKYYKMLRNDVK